MNLFLEPMYICNCHHLGPKIRYCS